MEAEVHEDNQVRKELQESQEFQEVLDPWENEEHQDLQDHQDHPEQMHWTMAAPDEMENQELLVQPERLVTQECEVQKV